ncbi:MAG: sulfotransferase domain-containing protein [Rubrobacteraceae bacterium]
MAEKKSGLGRLKSYLGRGPKTLRGIFGAGKDDDLARLREELSEKKRRLRNVHRRLDKREREIAALRARIPARDEESEFSGFAPENVVWIFCTGRSGSTWLGSMMGNLKNDEMWNEPLVGQLFGEFYYVRASHRRGGVFILGDRHRDVWLRSIRSLVLDGVAARYPHLPDGGHVVIKEPHGSIGAPLLVDALPESRVMFLVRDPRDVVSSAMDAHREGSWTSSQGSWKRKGNTSDADPLRFARNRAKSYLRDISKAREAYERHTGPKTLVRYEDLLADTLGTMKRVYSGLEIAVDEGELARVVEKHAWESIPEEDKGQGKFYRKATPGSWREDLMPEQIEVVERITAPLLKQFYSGHLESGRS